MRHIAREGETEYAVICRQRSGQDAGEIDYGLNIAAIHSLSADDRKELVKTAEQMTKALKARCEIFVGKP